MELHGAPSFRDSKGFTYFVYCAQHILYVNSHISQSAVPVMEALYAKKGTVVKFMHSTVAYRGNGGVTPLILTSALYVVSGQPPTPATSHPVPPTWEEQLARPAKPVWAILRRGK